MVNMCCWCFWFGLSGLSKGNRQCPLGHIWLLKSGRGQEHECCQNCCPVLELYYNLSSSLTYFITGFDSLSWFVYMLNWCSIDQCFSIILIVAIFGHLNSFRAFQTSRPFKVILPRHLRPIFLHSLVITTSFQPNATCSVLSRLRTVTSLPRLVSCTKKHCSFIALAWNHYQTKSPH